MPATLDDVLRELQQMRRANNQAGGNVFGGNGGAPATGIGSIVEGIGAGFKLVAGASKSIYGANIAQTNQYSEEEVLGGVKGFQMLESPGSIPAVLGQQIVNQLQNEAKLRVKINEETGLTGKLSEDVRNSILHAYPAMLQLGYGIEQISDFYTTMIEKSGRFNLANKEVLIRTAEVSRAFVGDLKQMAEFMQNFQNIGLGSLDTANAIDVIGVKSTSLGLRAKKTITDINENISELNAYGFKNGIQGLAEMSRKATEFRMNMKDVFTVAEKVFSPEGAIDLSANLQVIGGILGDFNDPLKLMYMATNNVEGLQTAMLDAAKSLATYNTEQGRFEVTGINLRRAQAMAKELGMDMKDLGKAAIAAAERGQAASAILATGIKMSDEDREFITNLSQMEGGEMVIKVPESLAQKIGSPLTIQLSQMSDTMAKGLLANKQEMEKQDAKSIAMNQLTLTENIDRNIMSIAATAKISLSQALKDNFETMDLNVKLQTLSGLTGKKVEDLTASGGNDITSFLNNQLQKVRGLFTSGNATEYQEQNRKILESIERRNEKATEARKVVNETKITHQLNASPTLLDSLGRHIVRNPQTWEDMYGSTNNDSQSFLRTNGRTFYQ